MPNTILWWALTIIPWHLHMNTFYWLTYWNQVPVLHYSSLCTAHGCHWWWHDQTHTGCVSLKTSLKWPSACWVVKPFLELVIFICYWSVHGMKWLHTMQLKWLCHKIGHYTYSKHLELCPQVKTFITHICTICIVFNLHKCTACQPLPFDITNQVSFKCPT